MNSHAIDLAVDGEQLASVNAGDNLIVYLILLTSLVALAFAALFAREVLAAGQGTPKMIEIAKAVQEGAAAYLSRQFKTLAVFAAESGHRPAESGTAFARDMLAPAVLARSAAHRSSMVQDIEAGRRTEIDTLNGAVARLGAAHGIPTPAHDTLIALIKARSPA